MSVAVKGGEEPRGPEGRAGCSAQRGRDLRGQGPPELDWRREKGQRGRRTALPIRTRGAVGGWHMELGAGRVAEKGGRLLDVGSALLPTSCCSGVCRSLIYLLPCKNLLRPYCGHVPKGTQRWVRQTSFPQRAYALAGDTNKRKGASWVERQHE